MILYVFICKYLLFHINIPFLSVLIAEVALSQLNSTCCCLLSFNHWSFNPLYHLILYIINSILPHLDLVVESYTVHEMPFTSSANLLQMDFKPKCQMLSSQVVENPLKFASLTLIICLCCGLFLQGPDVQSNNRVLTLMSLTFMVYLLKMCGHGFWNRVVSYPQNL